jgi:hypothetical protein
LNGDVKSIVWKEVEKSKDGISKATVSRKEAGIRNIFCRAATGNNSDRANEAGGNRNVKKGLPGFGRAAPLKMKVAGLVMAKRRCIFKTNGNFVESAKNETDSNLSDRAAAVNDGGAL